MKKNKLLIGIRSMEQSKQELLALAKKIDAGWRPEQPINRLFFENEQTLFRALSPKRMELLKLLRHSGPMSIRKLANSLSRDYKNVYDDVQHLCKLDLVQKKRDQKLYVPWDDLTIELNLAA